MPSTFWSPSTTTLGSSRFYEDSLCIAAAVDNAEDSDLRWLHAIEDHMVVCGKYADVGALGGFEALADVRKLRKQCKPIRD